MAVKKTKRIVEKGRIYITATFNNTLVCITDEKGNPIVLGSSGMFFHCSLNSTREVQQWKAALWINFSYVRMLWSSLGQPLVRLFALRKESQHGYQRQIFELGDSTEVQSTLAADDSTYSRNDVEQLRGSRANRAHSGSHGRPSNEHLMWPSHHFWSAVREPS